MVNEVDVTKNIANSFFGSPYLWLRYPLHPTFTLTKPLEFLLPNMISFQTKQMSMTSSFFWETLSFNFAKPQAIRLPPTQNFLFKCKLNKFGILIRPFYVCVRLLLNDLQNQKMHAYRTFCKEKWSNGPVFLYLILVKNAI